MVLVVATVVSCDGPHQNPCAVRIQGIVASLHAMMVMPVGLIPKMPSAFENHRADNFPGGSVLLMAAA